MRKRIKLGIVEILVAVLVFIGMIAILAKPSGKEGEKEFVVEVEYDETFRYEEVTASDQYLGDWLEQQDWVEYEDSSYGMFIVGVDGRSADEGSQEWWCILVNGESAATGVSEIVIEGGAVYKLELKKGW